MSRINRIQAEALAAPLEKAVPTTKTVATKKIPTAKASPKPATIAKTLATSKPAVVKTAAKSPPKKAEKVKVTKPAKEKMSKLKMERDSFTMPKTEYAQFHVLKERLNKLGQPAKKSELLRAGIMQLSAMTDAALKAAMSKVPAIKTGRPKK
jgi:hypothetical protein